MEPLGSATAFVHRSLTAARAAGAGPARSPTVTSRRDLESLVKGPSAQAARSRSPLYRLIPTFREAPGGCQAHLGTLLTRLSLLQPGQGLASSGFRWLASRGAGPGGPVQPGTRDQIRRTGDTWTLTMVGNDGKTKAREIALRPGMLLHLAEGVDRSGQWNRQHWVMWLGGEKGLVLDSIPRQDDEGRNLPGTGKFWEWSNSTNWNWNGGSFLRVRSVLDPLAGKD